MKKRIFAGFLLICLSVCLCACGDGNTSKDGGDEPKIEDSANLELSESSEDKNEDKSKDKSEDKASADNETAAKSNRVSYMTVYGSNDEVYYRHELTYDGSGKLISVTSYNSSGEENGHVDVTYDEHGNKLVYYSTTSVGRTYYNGALFPEVDEQTGAVSPIEQEKHTSEPEYDSLGNLIKLKQSYYKPSGELSFYTEVEYNDDGKRSSLRNFDENGRCYWYELFEYDAAGNLITSEKYSGDSDDTVDYTWVYEYNSEGNEIKSSMYAHFNGEMFLDQYTVNEYIDGVKLYKTSDFDAEGNIMRYTVYENGETIRYEVYEGQEILWTRTVYS